MDTNTRNSGIRRRVWQIAGWAVALLCAFAPALALAQTLTGTFKGTQIGRQVAFTHGGKQLNDWAGVLRLQLDNGPVVPVFCVQLDVRVRSGDRYRSDGPVLALPNGCRIRYLLDAYPASTAKDADEAAARQLAIWVFSDNLDPATIQDAKLRDRTTALVTEAEGKPCANATNEAPDLAIDPPTASAGAGQAVSYSIHAGASYAGQAVVLSVDGLAVFSDPNGANTGQQKQQVPLDGQGNATIWLLSTGAGQSTLSAVLPYRLDAGTVFSHLDTNQPTQRLVMAERRSLQATASAKATWAAAAPSPAPATPPAQVSATPVATAPSGQATPVATAPSGQATASPQPTPASAPETATPAPTRRPSSSRSTAKPTAEQATVTPQQAATGTPVPWPVGSFSPSSPAGGAGQTPVTAQSPVSQTGAQATAGQAAGGQGSTANHGAAGAAGQNSGATARQGAVGTAKQRPASLPRTGAPSSPVLGIVLASLLALIGGWSLRRRVR